MGGEQQRVRAEVLISGRVQGVCFRAYTQRMARSLGLSGYVRNLDSGDVAAVFEGPPAKVRAAVAWCRRGPEMARVDSAHVTWTDPEDVRGFIVRY